MFWSKLVPPTGLTSFDRSDGVIIGNKSLNIQNDWFVHVRTGSVGFDPWNGSTLQLEVNCLEQRS